MEGLPIARSYSLTTSRLAVYAETLSDCIQCHRGSTRFTLQPGEKDACGPPNSSRYPSLSIILLVRWPKWKFASSSSELKHWLSAEPIQSLRG